MSKIVLGVALGLGALFFSACSQNMARFSFASTSSLPVKMEKGESVVKGKDCITRIFFWYTGNTNNRISGAVSDALNKAHKKGQPSDILLNVDISRSYWSAFFVARDCWNAEGIPATAK